MDAMRRLTAVVTVAILAAGCASTPATPVASVAAPTAPTASPQPAAIASPTPATSASISGWTRVPASEALQTAAMTRAVAGPAGLLALGSRGGGQAGTDVPEFASWWSGDGIEWSRTDAAGTAFAGDVVALPDGFVIVGKIGDSPGQAQATTWRSSHGIAWTAAPIGDLKTGPFAAARIGGRLTMLAIRAPSGGEPTLAWSSSDLVSWTSGLLGGGGFSAAAGLTALSDGSGLAFGRWSPAPMDTAPLPPGQAAFWQSTDGQTWQKTPPDSDLGNAWVIDAAQAPGAVIVAVGQRWDPTLSPDLPYTNAAWWFTHGSSWERAAWPASLEKAWTPTKVVGTGGGYVVLASDRRGVATALIARSADGRTWSAIEPPIVFEGGQANDLVAVGDRLVVVGQTLPPGEAVTDAVVWIGPATVD
jgi:hypothetical protein